MLDLKEFFIKKNKSGYKTKEKWLLKHEPEIYKKIIDHTSSFNENLTFKEKIWLYINDKKEIPKCECNKNLKFKKSLLEGYGKYCSITCTNKSDEHKNKIKKTNLIKYNVTNPMHSKHIRDKVKQTNLNKYGVSNIFENVEYIKEKTLQKFGVTHISKLESTKINRNNTNIKKYGVTTPLVLSKNRGKVNEIKTNIFLEKYKSLNVIHTNGDDITIKCDNCDNNYTINRALLWYRYKITNNPCLLCHPKNSGISITEKEISNFITSLDIDFEENDRNLIKPYELDILIPSHNVAIEFNGLYWHSEKYVDKYYHLNKTQLCNTNGYKLIHIFEDEWINKKEIVKSRIKNILGLTENKIYARKCEIKEVKTKDKTRFLNENHIQGAVGSRINLGLYYNNELVSLMTFGKRPILNKSEFELIRFCNKINTNVVGGASRLLKYFVKTYKPNEITSYADRRWSTGNLYNKLGFKFTHNSEPNWFLIENDERKHRIKYQKHKLVIEGFDKNKTAHQICLERGLFRIYDCGTIKYNKVYL
jgi:hypothetical protein